MGSGSLPNSEHDETRAQTFFAPPFPRSQEPDEFWRREPKRRYVILLLLTFISTTFAGIGVSVLDVVLQPIAAYKALASTQVLSLGLWYSIPVLLILGARSPIAILLTALAGSFGVFHVFYHWLKVPLPIGEFGL